MPPPDISQQDSLALAQAKALAESGIDPSKPGPASAFLEDELGGYYHRLGTDQCAKQRRGRAQIKLKGDNTIGNKLADSGGNSTNENGAGCGIATLQQRQQQQQQLQQQGNRR